MIDTDDLLAHGGIEIRNLDAWFAATNKTLAAQQLYLQFPDPSSSAYNRFNRCKKSDPDPNEHHRQKRRLNDPELDQLPDNMTPNPNSITQFTGAYANATLSRGERMVFQILYGVTLGAMRFQWERDMNQKLDQFASHQRDITTALGALRLNQKHLIFQGHAQMKMIGQFKEAMLRWAKNFADWINPVLEVQTINDRALLTNRGTMQEVSRANRRLDTFIQAAVNGYVNADILSTSEFDTLALTIQDMTALRAIHIPSQIPCAMMPHSHNQTIMIHFAIPLTEPAPYSLIQLLPIKVFQDGQSVIPNLQYRYVALAANEYHYHPLPEAEYRLCLLGPCTFDAVASTPLADQCGLEQYFGKDPLPCEGIVLPEIPRDTFISLGDQGTIFSIVDSAIATISCPSGSNPMWPPSSL
jgi:hypothetical protein